MSDHKMEEKAVKNDEQTNNKKRRKRKRKNNKNVQKCRNMNE